MNCKRAGIVFLGVASGCIGAFSAGIADAQVLVDTGRGVLNSADASNGNAIANLYEAGETQTPDVFRDHFDFSIPTIDGTLESADLVLTEPNLGSGGHVGATTTFSVYSLGTFGTYGFSDIGAGTLFGSVSLDTTSNGTLIDISLNSAALSAISADQGGAFSLGGVDSGELTTGSDNHDFAQSQKIEERPGGISDLVLSVQAPAGTPEPGTIGLLFGAGVFAAAARRRARQGR